MKPISKTVTHLFQRCYILFCKDSIKRKEYRTDIADSRGAIFSPVLIHNQDLREEIEVMKQSL